MTNDKIEISNPDLKIDEKLTAKVHAERQRTIDDREMIKQAAAEANEEIAAQNRANQQQANDFNRLVAERMAAHEVADKASDSYSPTLHNLLVAALITECVAASYLVFMLFSAIITRDSLIQLSLNTTNLIFIILPLLFLFVGGSLCDRRRIPTSQRDNFTKLSVLPFAHLAIALPNIIATILPDSMIADACTRFGCIAFASILQIWFLGHFKLQIIESTSIVTALGYGAYMVLLLTIELLFTPIYDGAALIIIIIAYALEILGAYFYYLIHHYFAKHSSHYYQ